MQLLGKIRLGGRAAAAPEQHPAGVPGHIRDLLRVGSMVFLFPKIGGVSQKVPTRLVGWKTGEYLILSQPMVAGRPFNPVPDSQLMLRYIFDGEVYGLASRARGTVSGITSFLLVDYPTAVATVPLRAEQRVPVRVPAVLSWLPAGRAPEGLAFGFLRDLGSEGGMLELSLPEHADPTGRWLSVSFGVGQEREVHVRAEVRNVTRDGRTCRLGVRFHWSDPSDRERLEVFCRL